MSKEKQNVTIDVNPTQALKNLLCVFDEAQNLNSETLELLGGVRRKILIEGTIFGGKIEGFPSGFASIKIKQKKLFRTKEINVSIEPRCLEDIMKENKIGDNISLNVEKWQIFTT